MVNISLFLGILALLVSPNVNSQGSSSAILLHAVAENGLTAELFISGTRERPRYLFRGPEGDRLRVDVSNEGFPGKTITYSLGGSKGFSVDKFSSNFFGDRIPMIVRINGRDIAGIAERANREALREFHKNVSGEFRKAPIEFQRAVRDFYLFFREHDLAGNPATGSGTLVNAEREGVSSSESYKIETYREENEEKIASFQREFTR